MFLKSIAFQLLFCALIDAQNYDTEYHVNEDVEEQRPDFSKYFSGYHSAPLEENSESGFVKPLEFSSFFGSPQFDLSSTKNEEALVLPAEIKNEDGFVPAEFTGGGFGGVDYFEEAQKKREENDDVEVVDVANKAPVRGGYQEELSSFQKSPTYKLQKQAEIFTTDPELYGKYTAKTPYNLEPQLNSYGAQQGKVRVPYNPNYLRLASNADLNYEYLPSESKQNLKQGECVKVNKQPEGKPNTDPMTCYVCKNPKTGVQSEHCSYEQEPKSYYKSMSKTYSTPNAYRAKRDSENDEYVDPYEEVKAKSHSYYAQPEEFRSKFYSPPNFDEYIKYRYNPGTQNQKEEKSESEIETEEISKNQANCKEEQRKNGVTCLVCQDPKNGGNFEKCEYKSDPNEKKYAYVRESKYDAEPKQESEDESNEKYKESDEAKEKLPKQSVKETKKHQKYSVTEVDPIKSYAGDESQKYEDFTVFPKQSKQSVSKTKPGYFDATGKRDVERVLEEFSKKDRSNCKQVKKNQMTCYLCIDKKGIQNEECMYVSESQPQSSLIAYHQLERVDGKSSPKASEAESRIESVKVPLHEKKKKLKKVTDSDAYSSNKKAVKSKRTTNQEADPVPEFDINDKGGLYTSETKPVFVESLGLSLPKYMVEKSEYERDFDQTVSHNRITF
ncbi:hypothetical protein FQA39_LY05227 [Lamprigera yunnana]|nr:hypothetical protein FQA39_LY05227 [Lamprigera yunnana]